MPDTLLVHTANCDLTILRPGRRFVGAGQSSLGQRRWSSRCRVRLLARADHLESASKAKRSLREHSRPNRPCGVAPVLSGPRFSVTSRSCGANIVATKWGPAGTAWLVDRLVNKPNYSQDEALSAKLQGGVKLIVAG